VAKSWHSVTSGSTLATGACDPQAILDRPTCVVRNGQPGREFQALRSQAKFRAACLAIAATRTAEI